MRLEKVSMSVLAEKLAAIGGGGPLKSREWRIRCRLGWHDKSKSAVRHLLYGEQAPSLEEAKQIEAAYLKCCAERIRQNEAENETLLSSMRTALATMEQSDPEFFKPTVEAVSEMLLQWRRQSGEGRSED